MIYILRNIKKTNIITYMSRKLPQHSDLVLFFLRRHLPKPWKIKTIHNAIAKSTKPAITGVKGIINLGK